MQGAIHVTGIQEDMALSSWTLGPKGGDRHLIWDNRQINNLVINHTCATCCKEESQGRVAGGKELYVNSRRGCTYEPEKEGDMGDPRMRKQHVS